MPESAIETLTKARGTSGPISRADVRERETVCRAQASKWAVCVWVFLLALLLRGTWLVLMCAQHDNAALMYLAPDCCRYVQIGTYLAGLDYPGPELDWHSGPIYGTPEGSMLWSGPGYGLFLAAFFKTFGMVAWPVLISQVVMSSINCVLIYALACQLQFSRRVALLASLIGAFSLTSISLSCILLTETMFFTLQLCGLLWLVVAYRRNRWYWFIPAALLFGGATFVRGVTLFWPAVVLILALVLPTRFFAGSRKRLLINSVTVVLLMGGTVLGWSFRNYARCGVFTFSEGGVLAARYFWTARTLASFDPDINTRGMQHRMEEENLAKYGPEGATFAEHHRDDLAVFLATLRAHPWPMAKRFIISAFQNSTRGSELHTFQLPQFKTFWDLIKPVIHKNAGSAIMALAVIGALVLLGSNEHRAAGLILAMTYVYLCGITGFEFWQGSRISHPAQMAWVILVAVVLDRGLGLLVRRKRLHP